MKIIYITGNKFKILLGKKYIEPLGIEVTNKKMDLPEIQADTAEEVSAYSAQLAAEQLKENVLVNDSGLSIPALNNFPSVYTKYIEQTITEDGVLKLMEGVKDRRAYFKEALSYAEPGKESVTFVSISEGEIALEKEGEFGWSFDMIFIPKGETKPLACFNDDERWKFWSEDAYIDFVEYLKDKEKDKK